MDTLNKEFKEEELSKVNGGSVDWVEFSRFFMIALTKSSDVVITVEHKELVEAIKKGDFVKVATLAIPLIGKGDPIVMSVIKECDK